MRGNDKDHKDNPPLSERERLILTAIIEDYISTAEPVGSRTITKRPQVNVSAATIRNIMADLEELGLLMQPHTSAGRIPTDRAFRFYVDRLVRMRRPTVREQDQLESPLKQPGDVQHVMEEATRHLSTLSHLTGVMLAPRRGVACLHHLEFVRLPDGKVLVILVDQAGNVHNRILTPEQGNEVTQGALDQMTAHLNSKCQGLTMDEARGRILDEMRQASVAMHQMLTQAVTMAERALASPERSARDVFLAGETNVLNNPEFAAGDRMRVLLKAFEDRQVLIHLLDRLVAADDVQVFIGEETRFREMADCAVVAAPYGVGDTTLGCIGVIGPVRMDYARVVPLVELTAQNVSRVLADNRDRRG
jgi:heat-inducible transcriptional repressor